MTLKKKEKNKPKENKTMYFYPWIILLAAGTLFNAFPVSADYSRLLSHIAAVCRYFALFYAAMLLANYLSEVIARKRDKIAPVKTKKRSRRKKKAAEAIEIASDAPEAAPSTALTEADREANEKKYRKRMKLLSAAYVICQSFNMVRFIFEYTVRSRYYQQAVGSDSGFVHVGLTVSAAILLIVISVWMKGRPVKKGSETVRLLIFSVGIVCGITAFLMMIKAVLDFNTLPAVSWALRILPAITTVLMAVGMAAAIIKKEILTDFDYLGVFAGLLKKDGKTEKHGVADFLEAHTGLSLKSLWSIRYALSILPYAALGIVAVLFVSTCFFRVEAYQQAVVYRFGKITGSAVKDEGLHFKLPWPVDKAEIYDVHLVKELSVGYDDPNSADNLWTQSHAGEEYKLLLGNGNELVSVNVKISYVIDDLYKYVTAFSAPENVLSAKAYELILNKTITSDLNNILSVDRSSLADELRDGLNEFCKDAGFGLHVNQVLLESIHPPIEVADVYQGVVSAGIQKNTLITNARAKALEKTAAAEKEAYSAVVNAKSSQTARVSDVESEVNVFLAAAKAYKKHPDAVSLSKYLDTFRTVVKGRKVYVFIGDHDKSAYLFNLSGATLFSQSDPAQGVSVSPDNAAHPTAEGTTVPETDGSAGANS